LVRPELLKRGRDDISKIWRGVRMGKPGKLSSKSLGTPVLVQSEGELWRNVRNTLVQKYGAYLLGVAAAAVFLFWLIRGRIRLKGKPTGRLIERFTLPERVVHWYLAVLFLFLGSTGLILLFGRSILIPLFGKEALAVFASAALHGHNLFGPLFALSVVAMLVLYGRDNLPKSADFKWLFTGAGLLTGKHAPSWKFNAGEKIWFWIVIITGVAISASGLLLDFSFLATDLSQLQIAHFIHVTGALIAIAGAIGHIYLGSVGVEGALEGMTTGKVDENWAREHHDLWAAHSSENKAKKPAGRMSPAE
jgi:formate dehydrogenase subunit gamma